MWYNKGMKEIYAMVKDGWVYCPICNNKTRTKIRPDTVAENLPIFCPKCKMQSIVDVNAGFKIKVITHIV